VLSKVEKQLGTVGNTIQMAKRRTRAMEKTLRSVEQLPQENTVEILALGASPDLERPRALPDEEMEGEEADETDPKDHG